MGTEPLEEEMPYEFSDFPIEVQQALLLYERFNDIWEGASGTYLGKNFSNIIGMYQIYDIAKEDWQGLTDLLILIDKHRSNFIHKKQEMHRKTKTPAHS